MDIYTIGGRVADALERYGVGIPFTLGMAGVGAAVIAGRGVAEWSSLTPYGQFGLVVVGIIAASLIASAGFLYATVDTTWWLKTEEEDAQKPVELGESDDGE